MTTYDNTTKDMRAIGHISHWRDLVKTNLIMENLDFIMHGKVCETVFSPGVLILGISQTIIFLIFQVEKISSLRFSERSDIL